MTRLNKWAVDITNLCNETECPNCLKYYNYLTFLYSTLDFKFSEGENFISFTTALQADSIVAIENLKLS